MNGIRVARVSRLRAGAALLSATAARGAFPIGQPERRAIANAIRDSHEFSAIQRLLGGSEFGDLASAVQKAVKGTLGRSEASRKPYQFQSQLWVGSVFHAGGLSIGVPAVTKSKSPDYLVTVEGSEYGVEVKRPTKAANIPIAVKEAYEQLRDYDITGGVAIDVSDCLDDGLLFAHEADRMRPPHEDLETAFRELRQRVTDQLVNATTYRPSRAASRIFFAVVYLHGWRWFRSGPKGPELFSAMQFGRFVSAKGNLRYWEADRIYAAYSAGSVKTGLHVNRTTEEIL